MEEVGGDGFQPILKRKGREMKLETTFMSAMETLLTSFGSAFYNGTDAPRGTLGFFFLKVWSDSVPCKSSPGSRSNWDAGGEPHLSKGHQSHQSLRSHQ